MFKTLSSGLGLSVFLLISQFSAAQDAPYIYVLGVVQDAGYPQSGCYQAHCLPGWDNPLLRRGATAISVIDPTAHQKFLFEATPNMPAQLYQLHTEAPDDDYNLAGVFVTHAHIGHYAGLMFFGQEAQGASNVPVYAMPRMSEFLRGNGPWSQLVSLNNIMLNPLAHQRSETFANVEVTPFLVPHRDEYSETVGYRITGPSKPQYSYPILISGQRGMKTLRS